MKNIKTYEGFFDFLKSKSQKTVDFLDIYECIYDVVNNDNIKCSFNEYIDAIFNEMDSIIKNKEISFSILCDWNKPHSMVCSASTRVYVYGDSFLLRIQSIFSEQQYVPRMTDDGLKEIFEDIEDKLAFYGCKVSFYLAWGLGYGAADKKEYSVDKLFSSKLPKGSKVSDYNITMKVVAPGKILPNGLKCIGTGYDEIVRYVM